MNERGSIAAHPGDTGNWHPGRTLQEDRLGYLDPHSEWLQQEINTHDESTLVVPEAGEMLYRLRSL